MKLEQKLCEVTNGFKAIWRCLRDLCGTIDKSQFIRLGLSLRNVKMVSLYRRCMAPWDIMYMGYVLRLMQAASFFFGARIWLRMTFNYPVLWVRVKGQG